MNKRTHTCGELRTDHIGKSVTLNGWVNTVRWHGQVVFIDLRDRYGKTQLVFDTEDSKQNFETARKCSMEDVLSVTGVVQARNKKLVNPNIKTGEIEVIVSTIEILNEAAPLPFVIGDRETALEDLRLKHRYLELRTAELQGFLQLRHKTYQVTRQYLSENDFLEVETPLLMKSTPEGARDYLVPSRIHKGKFYALPQSPQTYKQLLMIAGFDRYFQIVKCFRDEDLRSDRQPEFTQIDIEMSFVDEADIHNMCEGLTNKIFKEVIDTELPKKYPVMSYSEAMRLYGTDKPDLRFGLELQDFTELFRNSNFEAFKYAELVNGIVVKEVADKYSRKIIDQLTDLVKQNGAKGLAWIKVSENMFTGGISKFINENMQQQFIKDNKLTNSDLLFFIGGNTDEVQKSMGALRNEIGDREDLKNASEFKPLWIVDVPMFEWSETDQRLYAMHHPFTAPKIDDLNSFKANPTAALSRGYDLVINGYEIAGGSIRNHGLQTQSVIFDLLGISKEEANQKFGFLLEALKYGAPPHGGIAYGYDRLIMILAGIDNIRDVIAFPKTTSALSLMDESPSTVSTDQLDELGIAIKEK
jgi:aspartyl-tRNA synthetase